MRLQEQLAGTEGAVADKDKELQAELEREERITNELKQQLAEAERVLGLQLGQRLLPPPPPP